MSHGEQRGGLPVRRRRYGARHAGPASSGERLTTRSRRGLVGRHWWAQRWSRLFGETTPPERLHRGRALARGGSVFRFRIETGEARGEVRHSRTELHEVSIRQAPLTDAEWDVVIEVLASRALYLGALLAHRLEESLEEALAERGIDLFPTSIGDLEIVCSCLDPIVPCSHVASVFYLVAERLDRDPFLLFRFRGRRRDHLLTECRRLRAAMGRARAEDEPPGAPGTDQPRSLTDGAVERPVPNGGFWGDFTSVEKAELHRPAEEGREVLDELGPPPTVEADTASDRALRDAYELGRRAARPVDDDEL